jgi:hypothetical protein
MAETTLTQEQIARIFALYVGCDYALINKRINRKIIVKLVGIKIHTSELFILQGMTTSRIDFNAENKLLLTPLSAITDEDAVEVIRLAGMPESAEVLKVLKAQDYVEVEFRWKNKDKRLNNKDGYSYSAIAAGIRSDNIWTIREYLIQKGYAVPLFIEPNHPLNGKTAIELGIAISNSQSK